MGLLITYKSRHSKSLSAPIPSLGRGHSGHEWISMRAVMAYLETDTPVLVNLDKSLVNGQRARTGR